MIPRDTKSLSQLFEWLEALCEDRLTPDDACQLEQLVLADLTARRVYLAYLDLHGTLHWNTAIGSDRARFEWDKWSLIPVSDADSPPSLARAKRRALAWWLAAAVVVAVALSSFAFGRWGLPFPAAPVVRNQPEPVRRPNQNRELPNAVPNRPALGPVKIDGGKDAQPGLSEQSSSVVASNSEKSEHRVEPRPGQPDANSSSTAAPRRVATDKTSTKLAGSVQGVVATINEHLAAGWKLYGIEPSPRADDAEWLRRVSLDLVGHIPPVDVAERFLAERDPAKREKLVEALLDEPGYVRHWAAVWTNLLVGRSDDLAVNRAPLQKFLRESFARNRPWNHIVSDLIAAEGNSDEVGATNFLMAHLNNDAMPATAITSRVFLGRQISCTQCHDHPFNDWKQDEFWSYHSFFEQTAVTRVDRRDGSSGPNQRPASALVTKPVGGPTHFWNRSGLAKVAYPRFEGIAVSDEPNINRREQLAKLMTSGEKPLIAEALVNRLWEHFLGFAFTRPVDDIGPHNPPSHPELLDYLAREFVACNFDLKQLMRWICLSDSYQRTSRFGPANRSDDPATGSPPLFSRVYVKSMTAEQLYDSLLLATGADKTPLGSGEYDRRRQAWLQQFVRALHTDENDESITFESSITQALLLMNSELIQKALRFDRGTILESLARSRDAESDKIKRLCLAALTRYPTPNEQQAIRRLLHETTSPATSPNLSDRPASTGWQDALWAYLNSNEFILVH